MLMFHDEKMCALQFITEVSVGATASKCNWNRCVLFILLLSARTHKAYVLAARLTSSDGKHTLNKRFLSEWFWKAIKTADSLTLLFKRISSKRLSFFAVARDKELHKLHLVFIFSKKCNFVPFLSRHISSSAHWKRKDLIVLYEVCVEQKG